MVDHPLMSRAGAGLSGTGMLCAQGVWKCDHSEGGSNSKTLNGSGPGADPHREVTQTDLDWTVRNSLIISEG